MEAADRVQEILPGLFRWSAFSPAHKVELSSHAVFLDEELWIFDPIPLSDLALQQLPRSNKVFMILTNGNHERDAVNWLNRRSISVFVPHDAGFRDSFPGERFSGGRVGPWSTHPLTGGAPGETAFRLRDRSWMVVGDAVVNLPERGLELLPDKYCTSSAQLRTALRQLLNVPFETLLMAHGDPILTGASTRVAGLL